MCVSVPYIGRSAPMFNTNFVRINVLRALLSLTKVRLASRHSQCAAGETTKSKKEIDARRVKRTI